jgi:beta-glucosidase
MLKILTTSLVLALMIPALARGAESYPRDFLWGAALSAHQGEGSLAGGGTESDWYRLEHRRKPVVRGGDTADVSADHWHRFAEDFDIARSLGLESFRTSIAWDKIEPAPGVFSREVTEHYREVLAAMHLRGIKPMLALHHFVHPRWFEKKGGWSHPDSPKWFLRYAEYVVSELGDLCDLWITFNEPMIQVSVGFLAGKIPPRKISPSEAYEAAWNILRAHRMVAAMIHRRQGVPAGARGEDGRLRGVGLATYAPIFDPVRPGHKHDVRVAEEVTEAMDWAFVRAVDTGRLTIRLPKGVLGLLAGGFDRAVPDDDLPPGETGPFQDWIGVNYYNRYMIQHKRLSLVGLKWLVNLPGHEHGDNGWAIYPEGLERQLRVAAQFGKPLVVTENGIADADDSRRPAFIREHLRFLDRAMKGSDSGPPLDVRGYYHWSLIDNFEWLEGYKMRFGLVEVQFENGQKRVPRASAGAYRDEILKRR